ncbi:hypothetical protein [Streptomyces sp. NPDC005093]
MCAESCGTPDHRDLVVRPTSNSAPAWARTQGLRKSDARLHAGVRQQSGLPADIIDREAVGGIGAAPAQAPAEVQFMRVVDG